MNDMRHRTHRRSGRTWLVAACLMACLLLSAVSCAPKKISPQALPEAGPAKVDRFAYKPVGESTSQELARMLKPGTQGLDSFAGLVPALARSLRYAESKDPERTALFRPGLQLTWGQVADSVRLLMTLAPDLDRDPGLLSRHFAWVRISPNTLMTGYFEPFLNGSLTPDPRYPYPLYGVPEDLKTVDLGKFHPRWEGQRLTYRVEDDEVRPYHSRGEIDFGGALAEKAPVVAWTDDRMDVYYLQIQGSGRLILPGGEIKHVLYAGKNGRRWVSIARKLLEMGILDRSQLDMHSIKRFFRENPDRMKELLPLDPSYVFFRIRNQGPYGATGAILTPRVSVAVDPAYIPLGSVLAARAELPGPSGGTLPLSGLVTAQDVGGAIKKNHIDYFYGSGAEAEVQASRTKTPVALYMLVARAALNQ